MSPRDNRIRDEEQAKARAIENRLHDLERRLGRKTFRCYVCQRETETYEGCLTVPPNPADITRLEDVKPVSTCSRPYCLQMESRRQDALVQTILAPQRDAYFQRRADERKKEKEKNK